MERKGNTMQVLCEICGKSCSNFTNTKIKDGYMCFECSQKMDGYIGKKHDASKITGAEYKEVLAHPMRAKMLRKKANEGKKNVCVICGRLDALNYFDDENSLCDMCKKSLVTLRSNYDYKEKIKLEEKERTWYESALKECYCPNRYIIFNFNTKKILIMDALSKKNYKLISFGDLVKYDVSSSASGNRTVRFLDMDYRYNGATLRYHTDDSFETEPERMGEFDKLLECLSMIQELPQNSGYFNQTNENVQEKIQNSININQAGYPDTNQTVNNINQGFATNTTGFRCPSCGGANCTPIVESSTSGRDFSAGKGCCGAMILGPIGILCGACGKGKQVTSTTYWICHNCGKKFQA